MIFCAFYTIGTIYETEAARLRSSLDKLGLDHDIVGVPDGGSWAANVHKTAAFTLAMQLKHDGEPVCYLDADAVVWSRPEILFALDADQTDLAFHRRRGVELLNGTLWLANTEASRAACQRYIDLCEANRHERDEQRFLWQAVEQLGSRWVNLPASYCWISDIMAEDISGEDPVIEHMQCSREASGSSLLPNRRARLAYLTSMGRI